MYYRACAENLLIGAIEYSLQKTVIKGMLYSKSHSSESFSLFTLFISQYLNGQAKYKDIIDNVIVEAHSLAIGEKQIFQVDRDKLKIIVHLKNADTKFFQRIDPDQLKIDDYRKLKTLLSQESIDA
ncbi:hypothetical protein [Ekhidna sp.]